MLAFLSDEWVAALDEALAAGHRPAGGAADETVAPLAIRQVVTGPEGPRSYVLWFDGPRAGVRRDGDADITLTCDRDTAVAIATGKERAQAAFLAGRLRLGGDSRVLMDRAGVLAGLGDAFAAVRARTDFGA